MANEKAMTEAAVYYDNRQKNIINDLNHKFNEKLIEKQLV